MNATNSSAALRRQSSHWLRVGMKLLEQLRVVLPVRAHKSITIIRLFTNKWGAIGGLPLRFSWPVDPLRLVRAGVNGESSLEASDCHEP